MSQFSSLDIQFHASFVVKKPFILFELAGCKEIVSKYHQHLRAMNLARQTL